MRKALLIFVCTTMCSMLILLVFRCVNLLSEPTPTPTLSQEELDESVPTGKAKNQGEHSGAVEMGAGAVPPGGLSFASSGRLCTVEHVADDNAEVDWNLVVPSDAGPNSCCRLVVVPCEQ